MNISNFKKDIKQHLSQSVFHCDRWVHLKNLVKLYKSAANIFNQHAPLETKTVTLRKPTPFVNVDFKHFKTANRKAERKWRKTGLEKDWNDFKEKRIAFNDHLNKLK